MLTCENCGEDVQDIEERCPTCGDPAGFPNVRVAYREQDELENRYNEAIELARSNGYEASLQEFDESMSSSYAVINDKLRFIFQFITNEKALYSNYSFGVKGQVRKLAKEEDDQQRKTVEAIIFGTYGENIRYAALSLDKSGVSSYGPFTMIFREVAIIKRASLLENNSYSFVEKHNIRRGTDAPLGYRAAWEDRNKLAVAKLAGSISSTTTKAEHAKILLFSEGKYETDEFIEVHIWDF